MTPEALAQAISQAIADLVATGRLQVAVPDQVQVERPRSREHGDYATNVAMTLAKEAGMPPRELAAHIVDALASVPGIEQAQIAGPGFINIRLAAAAAGEVARQAVEQGTSYGHGTSMAGSVVNVEFISANPTGPLHLGHTRWAAVGDAIARVLAAAGAQVTTEFYINDRGVQMDKFGASVMAAALGKPIPEDGYRGGYVVDLAAEVVAEEPSLLELPAADLPSDRRVLSRMSATLAGLVALLGLLGVALLIHLTFAGSTDGEANWVPFALGVAMCACAVGAITFVARIRQHSGRMASVSVEHARLAAFREAAYQRQLRQQQQVLELFRTHFDVWSSERSLHESNAVEHGFEVLRSHGHVFEADGAVWLRTTDFGDDKDRVLVKADGEYTYFASDTAYYVNKRERGFDRCIYLLGADHHGYVNRLRAVAACNGDPMDTVEVLIGQLVKITRAGVEVKLSKRAGTIVTLEELVEEVGVDAARYSLIRYPVDSPLTLDLDAITQRTNDNPVFYVQYAHARICSVLRNAAELGIDWRSADFDPSLLADERESELLGAIAAYPGVVASAAELREPHRIARYLEELATAYHRFYDGCRVLPRSDESLAQIHVARLWLCGAARQVIGNGLGLLGVGAPERM